MNYALLWSHNQNGLHIETVDDMLSKGRGAYMQDRSSDYIPLYIGTEQEVRETADAIRNTLVARQAERSLREAA